MRAFPDMKQDSNLWQFIYERLEKKQSVTLLVVAKSSGSSPGRQGFKMAVAGDELYGSIGGGVMEVSLVEQAKDWSNAQGPKSKVIEQIHRKDAQNSSGMICSGKQTVILSELNPDHLETVRVIISTLDNHRFCRLQITDSKFQISKQDSEEISEKISEKISDKPDFLFEKRNENEFVYEEQLGFKNKLFIIGGGHCALALSELMSKMGFHITLFDDRKELNTLQKNDFVHEKKIIESYDKIRKFIPSGKSTYVVVMTLGYKFDEIVIRKLFDRDFKYFGVLGSKAKMAVLIRDLLKDGFENERLSRIRTPIGLDINSQTPSEIAISIAAEIISVKNAQQ